MTSFLSFISQIRISLVAALVAMLISWGSGWCGAWYVQGLRITAAQQELKQYILDREGEAQRASLAAERQREQAAADYRKLKKELDNEIASGETYRRCVAAGKCGRMLSAPRCQTPAVPTPGRVDVAGSDAIPASPGAAEDGLPQVVTECAVATLMLNRLQADIEAQPGYMR